MPLKTFNKNRKKHEDTSSVNVGGGPPSVTPKKKKGNLPDAFLKNIKKKKEAGKEAEKKEEAALKRVMHLVYAEEARRERETA